jgi:ATP-dependent Clp protease ATP-binding subunit ClpA
MASIVRKEIDLFSKQLAEKKVRLTVTEACVDKLAEEGYSREFGARNVGRIIEEKIKSFFVDEVLFGRLAFGGKATVDSGENGYFVDITESFPEDGEDGAEPVQAREKLKALPA